MKQEYIYKTTNIIKAPVENNYYSLLGNGLLF